MKLLFLITGLAYGGAEIQLVNLAISLKKRGWEVRVVSMLSPQAFTEELKEAGIPLSTLNMRRGVADPRVVCRLVKVLREWRPDIVHSHIVHANLLARVARISIGYRYLSLQLTILMRVAGGGKLLIG